MTCSRKSLVILSCALLLGAPSSRAFSSYEGRLAPGQTTYVGLIAAAQPGQEAGLDKALQCLSCSKCVKALKKQAIANVSINKKVLTDKKTWYWIYFEYSGADYLKAAAAFEKAAPGTVKLIEPHPRAHAQGTAWLQMEWICYLRGVPDGKLPTQSKVAVVTRIRPEKESLYRTLHQSVWPGVIDQIARSHNRNLSIFLVEIGDEIYEFLYMEYLGHNAEADGQSNKSDPCTLRWWKLTDACQLPLPDVKEGIWAGMDPVLK